MRRAVISGATGAIGTALIELLLERNIEILVFCRENSIRNSKIPDNPLITKIYCDLKDFGEFKTIPNEKYDVFFHFAWEGTTGESRNDMYLQNNNVRYALDAVKLAERLGCKLFIGAGSQAEYGRVEGVLKTDTPANPENGYGIAKLCAGLMTRERALQLGLSHIWVRILSVYGPNDTNSSMVMSTINKLQRNEIPQCTKGEQVWDYLYSRDAAEAFCLLAEKGKSGKTYVLGSGNGRALKEYINDIKEVVNPECPVEYGAIPYSEKQVMHLVADITELSIDTNFKPKVRFKDGIQSIIKVID